MRNYHVRKNTIANYCPTINVENLWALIGDGIRKRLENDKRGRAPVLDIVRHGYFKVLGKGHLPKQPIIVKARLFSKEAERKIKEAGGACILRA